MIDLVFPTEAEATAAAAEYLDEYHPGWWQSVHVDKLEMQDSAMCVCGQAGLHWKDMPGFHASRNPANEPAWFYPFASQEAVPYWEKEIEERRRWTRVG